MSKKAAVFYSVLAELAARDLPPNSQVFVLRLSLSTALGLEAIADADTDKDAKKKRNALKVKKFLANIAIRLRSDSPALDFNWSAFDDDVQDLSLDLVIENIADSAKEFDPPKASGAAASGSATKET